MKAILTGMNGTVAPAVSRWLTDHGHTAIRWDRTVVPIDNEPAMQEFIMGHRPDAFLHIATGSPDWAESVARICAEANITFLFTSSVSVFSTQQTAPLTPDMEPMATDDYGRYKIDCERRVRAANPNAIVARLGWQIGTAPGSNNMVDYLYRTAGEQSRIEASTRWYPACCCLQDTAEALFRLIERPAVGLYHIEGNPDWNFHRIVSGLNRMLGNPWTVVACDNPVQDNRMLDPRVTVRPISARM